jgi:HEAT repeat protein
MSFMKYRKTLAARLRDSKPEVRIESIQALIDLQASDCAPDIAERLSDPDSGVRAMSVCALSRLGAREYAESIAALLKQKDSFVAAEAATALAELAAREHIDALRPLVVHNDPYVRAVALEAALKLDPPPDFFADPLADKNSDVRCDALGALIQLKAGSYKTATAKLLDDPDERVRDRAAAFLGTCGFKEYAPRLIEMLPSRGAVEGLRALGNADAIARCLKDSNPDVRSRAIEALAAMGAWRESIADLLKDPDEGVRLAAIRAVGELGQRKHLPSLAPFFKDPDWMIFKAAVQAAAKLGDVFLTPLTQERDPMRVSILCEYASHKDLAPALAELLASPHIGVRARAAEAIGRIQAKEFAGRLVPLLKDSSRDVRILAARALMNLDGKRFEAELGQSISLRDYDTWLSIGTHRLTGLAPALEPYLKDKERTARMAAAKALGLMAYRDSADAIAGLLFEPDDPEMWVIAAQALSALGATEHASALRSVMSRPMSARSREQLAEAAAKLELR